MLPGRKIFCLAGAFVVSGGLAQEVAPVTAIPPSWLTNQLSVVGVFPGANGNARYDANRTDVGIGMSLDLRARSLRFDDGVRLQDRTPVRTKPEAPQWRHAMESAERENLRLMNDYRSRAASPATPNVQPQFHPSAVEIIFNGPSR